MRRAVYWPYGCAPRVPYPGTNVQFAAHAPAPSLTQWPAVTTTSLLALLTVLAEQTKSAPATVRNTRPVVLDTRPPVIQRAPIVLVSGRAAAMRCVPTSSRGTVRSALRPVSSGVVRRSALPVSPLSRPSSVTMSSSPIGRALAMRSGVQ